MRSQAPGTAGRLHQASNVYAQAIFSLVQSRYGLLISWGQSQWELRRSVAWKPSSFEKSGWADGLMQHTLWLDPARPRGFCQVQRIYSRKLASKYLPTWQEEYFPVIFRVKKSLPGEIFANFAGLCSRENLAGLIELSPGKKASN